MNICLQSAFTPNSLNTDYLRNPCSGTNRNPFTGPWIIKTSGKGAAVLNTAVLYYSLDKKGLIMYLTKLHATVSQKKYSYPYGIWTEHSC